MDNNNYNNGYTNTPEPPQGVQDNSNQYYNNNNPANDGNIYNNAPYNNWSASPSQIYEQTHRQGAPQYHYGNNPAFNQDYWIRKSKENELNQKHKREIRSLGNTTGVILIIFLLISFIFSEIVTFPGIYSIYESNLTFQNAVGVLYSVVCIGAAFLIGSKLFKKKVNTEVIYSAPKDKLKALLLIFIGFGGCICSNYVVSVLRTVFETMGFHSGYTALEDPKTVADIVMIVIGTAVVPPLIEEFAMRGILLSNYERYGNAFAILASAFVFGIFHGNAVQIPFAFLCGLFLAYAVMATKSIWTGVIIHLLMNGMSCVSSALVYFVDDYAADKFYVVASYVGIAMGVIALFVYVSLYKEKFILKNHKVAKGLTTSSKFGTFITSPVLVIAVIIFVIEAISELTYSLAY